MGNVKLKVKDLRVGPASALRGISLDLFEGETLALLGESDSGRGCLPRAIMGLLGEGAVIEGGRVLYEGLDLLTLPEYALHRILGKKIAMVHPSPLSSLVPVQSIGEQLTRSITLHHRELQKQGEARFSLYLPRLQEAMISALGKGQAPRIRQEMKTFTKLSEEAAQLENAYDLARENLISMLDEMERLSSLIPSGDAGAIRKAGRNILSLSKNARNPHLIPAGDEAFNALLKSLSAQTRGYNPSREEALLETLGGLGAQIQNALMEDKVDFLPRAFGEIQNLPLDKAREDLSSHFLPLFLSDIEAALTYSEEKAREGREKALLVLKKARDVYSSTPLSMEERREATANACRAVEGCIDPLALPADKPCRYFSHALRGKDQESMIETLDRMIEHLQRANEGNSEGKGEVGKGTGRDWEEKARSFLNALLGAKTSSLHVLSPGMAKHQVLELMKEAGILWPHRVYDQYPIELTRECLTRLGIARALSLNPEVLLCEEPTQGLDVTGQAEILEVLERVKKDRNLSVLYITQNLGVAARMADRVAVMYKGTIVETGLSEEIFYDPRHPYTWALLSSFPDPEGEEGLEMIPDLSLDPDLALEMPLLRVTRTHTVAPWPEDTGFTPPAEVLARIESRRKRASEGGKRK